MKTDKKFKTIITLIHTQTHTYIQTHLDLRTKGTLEFQLNILLALSCSGGK